MKKKELYCWYQCCGIQMSEIICNGIDWDVAEGEMAELGRPNFGPRNSNPGPKIEYHQSRTLNPGLPTLDPQPRNSHPGTPVNK